MRIARSYSPRRRKRLPSAKCNSTVSGSTFTTSMKASIALSGCSFRRKLRPLKYERGKARDSCTRWRMSMRAAIQPSPKKSGKPSSHQYSNSIASSQARDGRRRRRLVGREFLLQRCDLPSLAEHRAEQSEKARQHADEEAREDDEEERRVHLDLRQEAQRHVLRVPREERGQHDEHD